MPLIKVIITAIYYLIVLFLMNPLTDIMGIKDGPFQFILTESIILIAIIILNRRYVKQPIHWLPVNIMSILRKNSLPLSLAIIFLLIFFRNHMYQFLISLLLSLIVAITEEYAFRGMIFRTLLALNLKKFATLQVTIASMMTASLIFAAMHLVNLLSQPVWSVLCQVLYVIGLGILLAAIYLKTGSLLAAISVHWLIDFSSFYSQGIDPTQSPINGPMEALLKGLFLNILFIGIATFILSSKHWKLLSILNIEDKIDE
ncbi:CPBP family intramembrane glutamic endopeptidase [Lactiplantibacillus plantarum]|uniref:CPBP family intramembrane glutamic endopeptidase n=1 Tax=Lactiplantibacillus plantarum TaxID=1590 RepID=UPI00351CA6DE